MPSRKVSVLVVDDDIRILRMMQRILELEGCRVLTVSNGEAALNIFDEENLDLVLLDIMMPGIDGYAVCQRIREFLITQSWLLLFWHSAILPAKETGRN